MYCIISSGGNVVWIPASSAAKRPDPHQAGTRDRSNKELSKFCRGAQNTRSLEKSLGYLWASLKENVFMSGASL